MMTIIENSGIESGQDRTGRNHAGMQADTPNLEETPAEQVINRNTYQGSAAPVKSRALKRFLIALLIIVIAAALFGAGYLAGKSMAPASEYEDRVSFYALIIANDGQVLHVTGIPENDVNHRGEAFLSWNDSNARTEIFDQYDKRIALSDLQPDDMIRVYYTGPVLESYPVQINGVQKITLLDE